MLEKLSQKVYIICDKKEENMNYLDEQIEILQDIVISLNAHRRELTKGDYQNDVEWKRFTERIEALNYAISILISKKSRKQFSYRHIKHSNDQKDLKGVCDILGFNDFYIAFARKYWTVISIEDVADYHRIADMVKRKEVPFLYEWGSTCFIYCDEINEKQIKKILRF